MLHKKHRLIISFQNMSTGMRVLCLLPIILLLIDHNIAILIHVRYVCMFINNKPSGFNDTSERTLKYKVKTRCRSYKQTYYHYNQYNIIVNNQYIINTQLFQYCFLMSAG